MNSDNWNGGRDPNSFLSPQEFTASARSINNTNPFTGHPSATNVHVRNDSVINDPHGYQNFEGYPLSAPIRSEGYGAMQLDLRGSEGSGPRQRSSTMPGQQHISQSKNSGSGQFDNRVTQSGQFSYPGQRQVSMDITPSPPMSSSFSGSSAASNYSVPPNVICKCRGPPTDGRLITCSSCWQTFHMTCFRIYNESPNFKCWTCQSQVSQPAMPNTSLPAVASPNPATGRGSGPSLVSNSISVDRDRGERRKDVSPHPYSSASGSVPNDTDDSFKYRNTDIHQPPAASSHVQYPPPPHMAPHSSKSTHASAGTSTTGYGSAGDSRGVSVFQSTAPYASSERPPHAVRAETLPATSTSRARNQEPCGYCLEHGVKCDIDPPFSKTLCKMCHEQNYTRCPSDVRNASSPSRGMSGGSGMSFSSNSISGGRDREGRRSDLSPQYPSASPSVPGYADASGRSQNPAGFGASGGRTSAGYGSTSGSVVPSTSSYTPAEKTSHSVRQDTLSMAPPSRTRNPDPCGYCQENRVKCDIDPPFSKALCRKCYEQKFERCPPSVKKEPRY